MFFLLYLFNHMMTTMIRAYLRTKKLRYVSYHSDRDFGTFQRGFERRILRMTTFMYAAGLTLTEYFLWNQLYS